MIACFVKKLKKNILMLKSSLSELVIARRSTVLSLPFHYEFPALRVTTAYYDMVINYGCKVFIT
jgi:hypothetical protein